MTDMMTQDEIRHPLSPDILVPLSSDDHRTWRILPGDFAFVQDVPFIPIVLGEFVPASRSYPIVFSVSDIAPYALLGLERINLFVESGVWGGPSNTAAQDVYIPAVARRYPFGFLRTLDDRFILAIDDDSKRLRKDGVEGEALFVDGKPSPVVQQALTFCDAFQAEAANTMAFAAALDERELLIEQRADITLNDGRKLGLNGFRIVDQQKFQDLDAATVADWHGKGWLALVNFHLASLERLQALVHLQSAHGAEPAFT